jgi:hypothetical protein
MELGENADDGAYRAHEENDRNLELDAQAQHTILCGLWVFDLKSANERKEGLYAPAQY